MRVHKLWASEIAALDSNVYAGGGTDDTPALQKALDLARDGDGVWLVMDGAALVSQLKLYSNTTIECLSKECGFFQLAQSNCAILTNAEGNAYDFRTENVKLLGGTYNQDCKNQKHDILVPADSPEGEPVRKWTFGIEFYGVKNFVIRDLTIRNFRSFGCTIGGFQNVTIENVWFDLPDHEDKMNQDGFHFWGPGRFLTVRNVGGRVGDDFMNIGPDERDKKSSITDVLVDGVFLEEADQAIRMLSRAEGRLDRVTVRNVSGTYKSYGFYINPWFGEPEMGDFGNILIENVDLKALKPNYDYRPPVLFSIGGNIETLLLKNVRSHGSYDNRTLIEIGSPFDNPLHEEPMELWGENQRIQNVIVEDLLVTEWEGDPEDTDYITVHGKVERLVLRNIKVLKNQRENGTLLSCINRGRIDRLITEGIYAEGLEKFLNDPSKVKEIKEN